MGVQTAKSLGDEEGNTSRDFLYPDDFQVATPIHTSSHYQTFETPFLPELVGGDRNMEQNNLIVTSDGKTWDEVTRDTSYLGNTVLRAHAPHHSSANTWIIFDEWRGNTTTSGASANRYNKDFAISYDRLICLKSGQYRIDYYTYGNSQQASTNQDIYINNVLKVGSYAQSHDTTHIALFLTPNLNRGDYVQVKGCLMEGEHNFEITRM